MLVKKVVRVTRVLFFLSIREQFSTVQTEWKLRLHRQCKRLNSVVFALTIIAIFSTTEEARIRYFRSLEKEPHKLLI